MTARAAALVHRVKSPDRLRGQPHGSEPFRDIQQQGRDPRPSSGGSQHIGGSDVAAAGCADILSGGELHQQEAEGDRSDNRCCEENASSPVIGG